MKELVRSTRHKISDDLYRSVWKFIISSFKKKDYMSKFEKMCRVCFDNRVDGMITTCLCKKPNFCISCLLMITLSDNMCCPLCRVCFDPYQLRQLKPPDL